MHIEHVRVRNYCSILDSGRLSFVPGFNLIVGANNAGKSAFLRCLESRFQGLPHRSMNTLPRRDSVINAESIVDFEYSFSGPEWWHLLKVIGANASSYLPSPKDVEPSDREKEKAFDRYLQAEDIRVRTSARARGDAIAGWTIRDFPATQLGDAFLDEQGRPGFLHIAHTGPGQEASPHGFTTGSSNNDAGLSISRKISEQTFRFHAERWALANALFGPSSTLSSRAENLAGVLNVLQANPERFNKYCRLVSEIFPTIKKISVQPHPTIDRHVEIMVWQIDPALERNDLAISLENCGTGIGQVLAILYVVTTSEFPRIIIIDEPGSFLNPGACRVLIQILKQFPIHQYIIATHSPEIISELSDAPVTILRWQDSQTKFEQFDKASRQVAATALNEVGARLSDVFGYDEILWVEGRSDALAFRSLLEAMARLPRRLGILPVRDTDSFKKRSIAEVLALYRSLSQGGALLPPAVLFLFDREERSAQEIDDARRQSRGLVRFLGRRMIENYLIDAKAIVRLIEEEGRPFGIGTSETDVENWIRQWSSRLDEKEGLRDAAPFSPEWLQGVHGARLLADMIESISDGRLRYRKTDYTPRLAKLLWETNKVAARELIANIESALQSHGNAVIG